MRVLVTGGTGFVGSHTVAAAVAAGHEVRLLIRSPERMAPALAPHAVGADRVQHVVGDVTDPASVREALRGCDAVIHAGSAFSYAVPFWRAPALMRTNVEGTATVLRTAADMGLDPVVHVSSSFAIVQARPAVLTEDAAISRPPQPYPRSKARAEAVARALQEAGAPVVITYPGMVWGPDDPHWGETCHMVASVLRGGLRVCVRGPVPSSDVREVARLHAAVLERGRGPRRYLVPSHSPDFPEMLRCVAEATGRRLPTTALPAWLGLPMLLPMRWAQALSPFAVPVPYAGVWFVSRRNVFGEGRAREELGIRPRPFADSVRDTLVWMAGTGRLERSLFGVLGA